MLTLLRRRIAWKLTVTLVGFVAISLVAAGLYLGGALERAAVEAFERRLVTGGRLLAEQAASLLGRQATPPELHRWATQGASAAGARVTLVTADGRVVADSRIPPGEIERVESHAERPEIRGALGGGIGRATRRSATVDVPLLYVAVPVHSGGRVDGAVRLAMPMTEVSSSFQAIHRALLAGGLVALAVAAGIGIFVAGRVTRPVVEMQAIAREMAEGRFDRRVPVRSTDETGALGRALNGMAIALQDKISALEHERARALFGLATRGEGQAFMEVIRNGDLHTIVRGSRVAEAGAVSMREVRILIPQPRMLEVKAVPLVLTGDEPGVGVVLVLDDVTALRRLERVRTEFVANVSHELRTPLTAIQGYLETLLGGALEERENARRFLDIAFRHTQRLGRLLDDLTDLSNIELNKVTLVRQPLALDEVVDSVVAIVQPKAEARHVAVTSEIPASLPRVDADHDRLEQVLLNLVDNAVKYTGEGGHVTVRATASVGGGMVVVEVADTGIGIPPADLPRITERFYRVDKARSRDLGGTGLGLAIVKHLVIAHGGELSIDSTLGEGTTVRFTVPTSRAGAVAAAPGDE